MFGGRKQQSRFACYLKSSNMKHFLFLLLLAAIKTSAQEHLYVNTNNLILRDRPEKKYNVYSILHARCKVDQRPYDDGYKNNKEVLRRFYRVGFTRWDQNGRSLTVSGWVEKKYMVRSLKQVRVPGSDTSAERSMTLIESTGDAKRFNCAAYPYPKYKGGEKQFDITTTGKRIYHRGPRGGCYYIGPNGNKRYVDAKFCK